MGKIKIFVSHATKDAQLVNDLVDLIDLGCGISRDEVFCTSLEGMNIPAGRNFIDFIREQIQNPSLVLLVLSKNYLDSKFCLCELGAAWGMGLKTYPIIVPPLKFGDISSVLAVTQMGYINDSGYLDSFHDYLDNEKITSTKIETRRWNKKREDFLQKIPKLFDEHSAVSNRKETPLYDGSKTIDLEDFDGKPNKIWSAKENDFIGKIGEGKLDSVENCILQITRTNAEGRFDVYLQSYFTESGEKISITNRNPKNGERTFHLSCHARAESGTHKLLLQFRPMSHPKIGPGKEFLLTDDSWRSIDFTLNVPNYPDYQLRIIDFLESTKPGNLQIKNILLSEIEPS